MQPRVLTAADNSSWRLVLIDIFCMDGASLYGKILEDVTSWPSRAWARAAGRPGREQRDDRAANTGEIGGNTEAAGSLTALGG